MRNWQATIEQRHRDNATAAGFSWPGGWQPLDLGTCRTCKAPILWCITPAERRAPVDPDGTSHFATCPQADEHRRGR